MSVLTQYTLQHATSSQNALPLQVIMDKNSAITTVVNKVRLQELFLDTERVARRPCRITDYLNYLYREFGRRPILHTQSLFSNCAFDY